MNCKSVLSLMLALLLATVASLPLMAQSLTSGDISGIVTDPSGAVVPNANVTVKSSETGATVTVTTNAQGVYRASLLKPGPYTVSISASGFRAADHHATVAIGQVATVNVTMSLGQESTTVEVSSEAPVIQTENADLSTNFNEKQVSLLPNPGNDLSFIAQTAPGVVMNTQAGQGNFSANGLPGTSNLFTVNGQNENDPFLNLNNSGATNLLLGSNDVREATVTTNGYSGQYGTLAGANVNYVTKSGTNSYHGNAIYYWNGSALNANSFFNNFNGAPKPFVNANQWAASFGGPIRKDKTFFFVDTEGLRFLLPTSVNATIPTPQFATATLNHLQSVSPASVPFYQNIFNLYQNAPGANRAQPLTGGSLGCGDLQDPASGLGVNVACGQQFTSTVGQLSTEWLLTGRIDQNIGNNDRLFGHFRTDHGFQASVTDVVSPLFNLGSNQPQYEGQLSETHSIGATMVNQFIMSGSWYSAIFNYKDLPAALRAMPLRIGFAGGVFSSLGRFQSAVPQGRNVTQYQFVDDFSATRGNHAWKVGVNFRRNDVSDYDPGIGSIGAANGTSLSDFFNGNATVYSQSFPSKLRQPIALYSLGFYGQDEWRIKPSLKLTFSLRADHFSNPVCQTDCFSRLTGDFFSISHDPNQPYNQAIVTGQHQALADYTKIEWQPRFGFTWNPFGLQTTVIRGGFGIFNDSFPGVIADTLLANAPQQVGFVIPGGPLSPDVGGNVQQQAAQNNAAFQSAFANGGTLASIQQQVPTFSPPSFATVASRIRNPRYQEWNLQLEQGIGQKTSVSLNYVGNHGIHETVQNPSVNAFCDATCLGPNGLNAPAGTTQFVGLPTVQPDPRFSSVTEISSSAVSNYNGVTASLVHRSTNLTVQANYTWSHALDEISNGGILQFGASTNFTFANPLDPFNIKRLNYGNADYDTRHYFSFSYVYTVPYKWGPKALLGGWTVSGTMFARTGLPYTVYDGNTFGTLNAFGYGFPNLPFSPSIAANIVGNPSHTCNSDAVTKPCLNAADFAPALTGFSNQRRNQFYGPGFFNTDLQLSKAFKIPKWEGAQFSIGANFFNILNHPHFDQPTGDITSGQFGTIVLPVNSPTSIYGAFLGADASPRLVQIQGKLTF